MGRMGQPGELAPTVLFLASDGASYITGQVVAVDGAFRGRFLKQASDEREKEGERV